MARPGERHVPFAAAGRGLGVLPGLARVQAAGSLPCRGVTGSALGELP
jgi:hypothetical protein